ncbi:hypothetical protein AMTR_s00311p00014250, partial [Amborella trichopoda]
MAVLTKERAICCAIETEREVLDDLSDCFEDGVKLAIEELQEVSLGTLKEPRPTFIAASLSKPEAHNLVKFLREYKDFFAWTYSEMPSLIH